MMEIYRTPSKETQEILLASAIYAEVIEGLNGYFASEPRNKYITIHQHIDSRTFYLYDPEKWADILISWLRTEHGVFYYPGMEAKYAKTERIPPFTERVMDEGALNSLKALYKRVIGQAVGINSHTLIADSIKCAVNTKEREIKKLKDRIAELESNFKAVCDEDDIFRTRALKVEEEVKKLKEQLDKVEGAQKETVCKDIMNYIRRESSRNGFNLPEEIDGEPLTIKRVFHDLLELLRQYGSKIKEVNDQRWKDLRDIHSALGCYDVYDDVDDFLKAVKARAEYVESLSRNAERETRKAVNEQLKKDTDYVADTLCDILEVLGISKSNTAHLSIPELKKAILRASVIKSEHGKYLEQLTEENEKLKETIEQDPSDTNKLIRDCCVKHSIIAPSRYLSDEACVEYLFSLIEQKDRSLAILQDLYRDIFKKQPDGLSAKDIANKILDRVLTTEDLLHKSVDSVNKECKATGRLMFEDYKLKLKDYILKDIEEHGYRYDGLQTKSIEEIVDWIITMATSDHSFIVLKDIYTTVVSPAERLRYKDCDRPTVDHMKDYILRRFEGLHANIEYCLKKMSELDGHKKNFEILKEKQEFLSKQNMELSCKLCAKDDEISRLKDLINAMNEEVKDM